LKNQTNNVPVKRKDEIVRHLLVTPDMTAKEWAVMFAVTEKTIKRDFAILKNEGLFLYPLLKLRKL